MTTPLYYHSIHDISHQIKAGRLSPVEVVKACLARIEALNPTLNAFITILGEDALQQAAIAESEIQAGAWRGPLHGIPVGIKDFYDTAGIKTTAAFEHFRERVPTQDAVAVTRLKNAGAIIIGKMNMHTLGMGTTGLVSAYGAVHNPWNDAYIPGGSSSGSAAAVVSGMCYATLDTDAVGSGRLPASCCGVVGFKATYGLIDTRGILEGEEADDFILLMSHAAITTRTVEDTALMVDALADTTLGNKVMDGLEGSRLAIGTNFTADPEVTALFEKAVALIEANGVAIVRAPVPFGEAEDLSTIHSDRQTIGDQAFQAHHLYLLPTTTTVVPTVEQANANPDEALSAENTAFANYYALPAITIPCGFDGNGLPVGLQIVAKPGDERTVLTVAYHLQQILGSSDHHPLP